MVYINHAKGIPELNTHNSKLITRERKKRQLFPELMCLTNYQPLRIVSMKCLIITTIIIMVTIIPGAEDSPIPGGSDWSLFLISLLPSPNM